MKEPPPPLEADRENAHKRGVISQKFLQQEIPIIQVFDYSSVYGSHQRVEGFGDDICWRHPSDCADLNLIGLQIPTDNLTFKECY